MRYNIFNPIHKALRAILYDTALLAQQTNFLDEQEEDIALTKIEQTLSLFDMHSVHEGDFIHPLIDKFNHDISRRFREKHVESNFLAGKVKLAINTFDHSILSIDKVQKGKSIVEELEAFVAFNLTLFIREEKLLNEILWDNYTDEEIMLTEQQIIAIVPADILQFESRWMMKALNNAEIESWLIGVKQSAPEFVFQSLLTLAGEELPAARFNKLAKALSPSEVTEE